MMPTLCSIPNNPVVVAVCTVEPDGSHRKRANLLADETQVPRLVSTDSSPLRDHTVRSLTAALGLDHRPITFQRARLSAPVIVPGVC